MNGDECSSGDIVYSPPFEIPESKQFPGSLESGNPPPRADDISTRVANDFQWLIHEIKRRLEEGKTAQDVGGFIHGPQIVMSEEGPRDLGVIIEQLEWQYEEVGDEANKQTVITGIIISGCMLRGKSSGNYDLPEPARNCEHARMKSSSMMLHNHAVYSSSSSSSTWGGS